MNPTLQKIIAVIGVGILGVAAYFGSYLPLRKSQRFIDALSNKESGKSLEAFQSSFSAALDIPSPIGQEEVVRNFGNVLAGIIRRDEIDPATLEELFRYLNIYYDPIIAQGRGTSFAQNLYLLGVLHQTALFRLETYRASGNASSEEMENIRNLQQAHLAAAKNYFLKGIEVSPTRPQFLYALFDIYRVEGNTAKVREIGAQILEQWPEDKRLQELLGAFLKERLGSEAR